MAILIQMLFAVAATAALGTIVTSIGPNLRRIIMILKGREYAEVDGVSEMSAARRRNHRREVRRDRMRRPQHSSWAA